MLNQDQLAALLRTLFQFLGGVAVGKGWVDADTAVALSGAFVTIGLTIWGVWARNNANLIASAAAVPEVRKIVAEPGAAKTAGSAKVVSAPGL